MAKYRLEITRNQELILLRHCSDARYMWNLCVEQENEWRPGRGKMPGYAERCRQLTAARAENAWLAEGSVIVQQQAIKDHQQAMTKFFNGTHGRPKWRKQHQDEGFRIVAVGLGDVRRLNRNHAMVKVPKAGWVRFRWSRPVPDGVKSFRVIRDRSGRWHIAFAVIPDPILGPGTGEVVGVDRGVAVSAALSTGELLRCPGLSARETTQLRSAQRKLSKAKRGSSRRDKAKAQVARLRAREVDRRNDWCEQLSTSLARRFDVIRVEDLKVRNMTHSAKGTGHAPGKNVAAKAGLNRAIQSSGWGRLVRRLEEKAPGRVEKVPPAYTSQCCSACGHVDAKSRKSQADFRCTACGFACNADVNAARNIAAGHAVKARGGHRIAGPVNREPQLSLLSVSWNPLHSV
ncbi:MAG: RNA-guided endonuclease InsQ/TnpB family protein [Trebonia sp.]